MFVMMTALEFADAIGRKKMADALGLGVTSISNAVVRGKFPPSWTDTSRAIADDMGVDFPENLFGQIGSYSTKGVFPNNSFQGAEGEKASGVVS